MKKYVKIVGLITLILFALSFIPSFCDVYTDTVYSVISDGFGLLMGVIPVNIGEILMYLAAVGLVLLIILCFLMIFFYTKERYKNFTVRYIKGTICVIITVLAVYMANWWIPFRSTLVGGVIAPAETTSLEELETLRAYIVNEINSLSQQVQRNDDGTLYYQHEKIVRFKVSEALIALAPKYKRLSGYYPDIKRAYCSDVLDWMNIGGYTYPYTMEITYNQYVTKLYFPTLYAHEAAHHQGYYLENEGNFFSFIGCTSSDDPFIRYSGYLQMYYYIHSAYVEALLASEPDNWKERAKLQPKLLEQVYIDENEAFEDAQKRYAADDHPLDTYTEVAEDAADIMWEKQSEILGTDCYDGVVPLLLTYYRELGVISPD